jgi:hypothetical protein
MATPVKRLAHQSVNDFLDLAGDDIASGEIGIIKNRADEPFGEQMLNEHFIDSFHPKVRV